VDVSGQVVDLLTQGPFDGAEDPVVGQVGQSVGHLGQRLLEEGPETVAAGLKAGFAVLCGRVRDDIL
jgi:hypothetical protein